MELRHEAELWLAGSFHDNPIRFQTCRSVRSSARAFRPVPTPASGASFTKASQSVHRNAASAIWYFKHLRLLVNKKVRFLLCAPPRSEQTGFLRC
jgi:hypothetical protein